MKVLGIKATEMTSGKNQGKIGYTYYMSKDFTDYDKETSDCKGCSVTQEFSYKDFSVNIGDDVEPIYEKGYQDRAILVNLVPFKPAK